MPLLGEYLRQTKHIPDWILKKYTQCHIYLYIYASNSSKENWFMVIRYPGSLYQGFFLVL